MPVKDREEQSLTQRGRGSRYRPRPIIAGLPITSLAATQPGHDRDALQRQIDATDQAKPYQIRQFLRLVERYNLQMRGDT